LIIVPAIHPSSEESAAGVKLDQIIHNDSNLSGAPPIFRGCMNGRMIGLAYVGRMQDLLI
jgi:hypothetical protein